jgi:mannosyltransferase
MSVFIDGIVFSLQKHGGISVYFQELLKYLNKNNIRASLALEFPLVQAEVEYGPSISTERRYSRTAERYRACRIVKKNSVFHSSYYRLPNQLNLPTVVTVHDFIYERYQNGPRKWVHSLQKKMAIRAAQAVICISEATKEDLLEFVGETPGQEIYVVHNGVSDVFKKLNLSYAAHPFILFVGQRAGYKNFKIVLAAMLFLPDVELKCVGGAPISPQELHGYPDSVMRRIYHLGFVSDEELNNLYNSALCLVYPSSYEGFGIPVLEAMSSGCPVVSMNCKAVMEIGRDALTVVSDLDARVMADAILRTASSQRSNLINRGFAIAQGYSWDATHFKTTEIYRSLGL